MKKYEIEILYTLYNGKMVSEEKDKLIIKAETKLLATFKAFFNILTSVRITNSICKNKLKCPGLKIANLRAKYNNRMLYYSKNE